RILLIDPMCLGARLRSAAESRNSVMVGRLEHDVSDAANALAELKRMVENNRAEDVSLEVKLYRLPPTMFLCHTEETAFVQQYHFWTKRLSDTPVPVIEYRARGSNTSGYP